MTNKILVTGGAGYIGSHTSKRLVANGFEPICYDNLSTGHREFVKWGPLEFGHLHDTSLLIKVLEKYKPIAVIHFAASAYVGESITDPFKYYRNNVGGTLSLLEAMQKTNTRRIVFSSSCATYGAPNLHLIDELCPLLPINPYGQSKLMIEKILFDLAMQNKISQVSLRYFNAAGADYDCEIGENHEPETHLIPLAIHSALKGSLLKIFGIDFSTPDGTAIRDYVHVEDLADAHIKAVELLQSNLKSECINLGTGKGYSVKEIIKSLEELGLNVNYESSYRRQGDPAYLVANPQKALDILNWKPKYIDIKDILSSAIKWHKLNTN
jgi:UDP-glucose-4-epimerase GalE